MVYSTHAPHDELNGGFMWVFEHSIDTVIDMSLVVAQCATSSMVGYH